MGMDSFMHLLYLLCIYLIHSHILLYDLCHHTLVTSTIWCFFMLSLLIPIITSAGGCVFTSHQRHQVQAVNIFDAVFRLDIRGSLNPFFSA